MSEEVIRHCKTIDELKAKCAELERERDGKEVEVQHLAGKLLLVEAEFKALEVERDSLREQLKSETRDLAEHWAILAEQRRVELEEWRELLKRLWIACPTALECNAFHHAKRDQHTYSEECKPLNEYVEAIEAVNAAMGVKP